ncbi:Bestrophin/UPF0187 [Glomus cerebriforme]|uniref:Bestrophin/UPF0187 n=1 Tax=Glomus cerebriforme TaxID=658196 RepID=A0A397TJ66_9GLOM|nr:Bestrophin/UPF0187 [Glomus cerebriforme]
MPKDNHPYAYHRPDVLRLKGSVLPHVIGQTIIITIITTIITVLYELNEIKLSVSKLPSPTISTSFTQVVGVVVGLLLTYKTNTAYDRYWEGRKLWSTMEVQIRNLTRYIWIGIREDGRKKGIKEIGSAKPEIVIEKKTAINLLLGFAFAVKHYLREENGCEHDDLKNLVSNIRSKISKEIQEDSGECNIKNRPNVAWYNRLFRRKLKPHERNKRDKDDYNLEDQNLPLDITHYLSSYFENLFTEKKIDDTIFIQVLAGLDCLCDCLSKFERILRSPIPVAYSIHFSQTVWIYCISLPFFLISTSHWPTIIIVFFVSFILFGLEHIATEIENPFGYDENDLKLDDFCK